MDYLSFCSSSRFNMSWNSLKYKYEYKINAEEFTLYRLLADEASLMALNLGLNHNLCEALVIAHAFSFCDYGYAGWNAIKEYFVINKLDFDVDKLKLDIVKSRIKGVKNLADEEFYGYVEEMYSNNVKTKEVKLVLECHRILKTLQPLRNESLRQYFDVVSDALSELKEKSSLANDIVVIDLEKYIPNDVPRLEYYLSNELKEEYHQMITDKLEEIRNEHPDYSFEQIIQFTISYITNS